MTPESSDVVNTDKPKLIGDQSNSNEKPKFLVKIKTLPEQIDKEIKSH